MYSGSDKWTEPSRLKYGEVEPVARIQHVLVAWIVGNYCESSHDKSARTKLCNYALLLTGVRIVVILRPSIRGS